MLKALKSYTKIMASETETSLHAASSWFLSLSIPDPHGSFIPTADRSFNVKKNLANGS